MYAPVTRPLVLLVMLSGSALAACGDDSGGSSSAQRAAPCTPGVMSEPDMDGDPCPQDDANCVAMGGKAVSTCQADMTWSLMCQCVIPSRCGNGVRDMAAGEQCDGADLAGQTCMSMNMGMGVLSCNPSTCMLDYSMCTGNVPTGGAGG